jgi:hypothetical protein
LRQPGRPTSAVAVIAFSAAPPWLLMSMAVHLLASGATPLPVVGADHQPARCQGPPPISPVFGWLAIGWDAFRGPADGATALSALMLFWRSRSTTAADDRVDFCFQTRPQLIRRRRLRRVAEAVRYRPFCRASPTCR